MPPGSDTGQVAAILSHSKLTEYTAAYRNSAFVIPVLLLTLVFYFALLAWAITRTATNDILIIALGATGVTILVTITVVVTALRTHRWVIEATGLRIEERPKVPLTGFTKRAFAPWAEIIALRRIDSGFERQIEVELRSGAVHRMAQVLLPDAGGRRCIPDHAGLDALAVDLSTCLAAAGAAALRAQEGLSFWNRLPGLAILSLMFVPLYLKANAPPLPPIFSVSISRCSLSRLALPLITLTGWPDS